MLEIQNKVVSFIFCYLVVDVVMQRGFYLEDVFIVLALFLGFFVFDDHINLVFQNRVLG